MNMKQSCKALICAIEGELDGRHCTEEQAAAILDHALPSLTEALARVEAAAKENLADERRATSFAHTLLAMAKSERDKAYSQLADVLYILDQHRAWTGMGWEQLPVPVHAVEKIRSKLAQAEQQEARNAEVARESLRPENQRIEPVEPLRVPHPLEAQGAQAVEFQRECCNEACGWKGVTDRVLSGHGNVPDVGPLCPECGETTERAAPPAAAHGDEAVRKDAERYQWLRDKAMFGTRHDPAVLKDGPTDCCDFFFGEELDQAIDAAIRAQAGEGGE